MVGNSKLEHNRSWLEPRGMRISTTGTGHIPEVYGDGTGTWPPLNLGLPRILSFRKGQGSKDKTEHGPLDFLEKRIW